MRVLDSILLVDKVESSRVHHEKLIKNFDLSRNVFAIEDGKEAFNWIKAAYQSNRQLPSLVIADISSSVTDNFDFIKEIENSQLLGVRKIPVAFLATPNIERDLENLRKIYPFATKPLDEINLFHILHATVIPLLSMQHQKVILERQKFLEEQNAYLIAENAALKTNIIELKKRRQELEVKFSKYKNDTFSY
ncbi:MAG: hypothetical protein K2X86_16300 [Cytophagaceae bacterium]|nr:hypothetical protein [Cytophagaceae bacterium]